VPRRPGATPAGTAAPLTTRTPAAVATGPATPTRTAQPTTAPPATGDPAVQKFTSAGGRIKATCSGPSTAVIQTAKPIKPFKLLSVDTAAGPAPAAVFKHGKARITMTITCQGGEPSVATVSD
jgi:serine/threonine-protein kinase